MSYRLSCTLATIALAVIWSGLIFLVLQYAPRQSVQKIDCSMAEFHPDFTPKMREQCRMVRAHKL